MGNRDNLLLVFLTQGTLTIRDLPKLPKCVGYLTNLLYFDLIDCDIKQIPKEIYNLTKIHVVE